MDRKFLAHLLRITPSAFEKLTDNAISQPACLPREEINVVSMLAYRQKFR